MSTEPPPPPFPAAPASGPALRASLRPRLQQPRAHRRAHGRAAVPVRRAGAVRPGLRPPGPEDGHRRVQSAAQVHVAAPPPVAQAAAGRPLGGRGPAPRARGPAGAGRGRVGRGGAGVLRAADGLADPLGLARRRRGGLPNKLE